MAIGSKRNFTITDLNKRTIVLRRCESGGALGSMRLTPVYSESYSLVLSYPNNSKSAWYTSGNSGPTPTLVDMSTIEGANPPIAVNILTSINVDKTQGVYEDGLVAVQAGFSGSFEIPSGALFVKPSIVPLELKNPDGSYQYTRSNGPNLGFDTVSIWNIELDDQTPATFSIGGLQDADDPLKYKYTIPIPSSSAPEWATGGAALAYRYKLGNFMEGIIRFRAPGVGGLTPSPICGTSIE